MNNSIETIIIQLTVIFVAIAIHEFAHAKFADMAGDPTPRSQGRVTLNPLVHFDPLGALFIVMSSITGIGFGWGRPVMVRPDKMNNPRWDHFISVAAGPLSNLLQAGVYALLFKIVIGTIGPVHPLEAGGIVTFLFFGVMINIGLAVFNLLPIGPLDGHWMVGAFLPPKSRLAWYKFNQTAGSLILLALIFIRTPSFDPLGTVMGTVQVFVLRMLYGV